MSLTYLKLQLNKNKMEINVNYEHKKFTLNTRPYYNLFQYNYTWWSNTYFLSLVRNLLMFYYNYLPECFLQTCLAALNKKSIHGFYFLNFSFYTQSWNLNIQTSSCNKTIMLTFEHYVPVINEKLNILFLYIHVNIVHIANNLTSRFFSLYLLSFLLMYTQDNN